MTMRHIALSMAFAALPYSVQAQEIEVPSVDEDLVAEEDEDEEGAVTLALIDAGAVFSLDDNTKFQVFGAYNPRFDVSLFNADFVRDLSEEVTLGFTYVGLWRFGGVDEHTVRTHVSYAETHGPWVFDFRAALDYRLAINGVDDRWRLRPRARVKYQSDLSGTPFVLYLSAEPTYNFNVNEIEQVGFAAGGYVKVSGPIWVNAFYQRTQTKDGPDLDIPAIGVFAVF